MYSNVQGDITVDDVTSHFKSKYRSVDLEDVFGEDSDYDVGRMLAQEFVEKAGITSLPQVVFYILYSIQNNVMFLTKRSCSVN